MFNKKLWGAALLVLATSCALLNTVSVTSIPANRAKPVTAEAHDWVILGLNFENGFVDTVRDKLREQCPNGKVSGILTKYEHVSYFLWYKRSVSATGYCETGVKL